MKVLVAVDGSAHSRRAVQHLVKHPALLGRKPRIELLFVDPVLPAFVARHLGRGVIDALHADNAQAALQAPRRMLRRAHLPFHERSVLGDPATEIVNVAKALRSQLIVMGSHGHGTMSGLVLGSVVTRVLATCKTPVLVVR